MVWPQVGSTDFLIVSFWISSVSLFIQTVFMSICCVPGDVLGTVYDTCSLPSGCQVLGIQTSDLPPGLSWVLRVQRHFQSPEQSGMQQACKRGQLGSSGPRWGLGGPVRKASLEGARLQGHVPAPAWWWRPCWWDLVKIKVAPSTLPRFTLLWGSWRYLAFC